MGTLLHVFESIVDFLFGIFHAYLFPIIGFFAVKYSILPLIIICCIYAVISFIWFAIQGNIVSLLVLYAILFGLSYFFTEFNPFILALIELPLANRIYIWGLVLLGFLD